MPPKEDPLSEILSIIRDELALNRVDKATWGCIISKRAVGKIRRRLEKLDQLNQPMEVK